MIPIIPSPSPCPFCWQRDGHLLQSASDGPPGMLTLTVRCDCDPARVRAFYDEVVQMVKANLFSPPSPYPRFDAIQCECCGVIYKIQDTERCACTWGAGRYINAVCPTCGKCYSHCAYQQGPHPLTGWDREFMAPSIPENDEAAQ